MIISNKIILITGGAVRLGKAITRELTNAGATVYCHYHSSENEARSLANELKNSSGKIHIVKGDLSEISFADELVNHVFQIENRIDILINNAAVFLKTPLGSISEKDWDQLFTLNLKAPFFLAQTTGLIMKKQGFGKIINIGDISGLNPWPGYIPYSLTKSGIIQMTKGLAKALAPEVLVNCINPGPVLIPENFSEDEIQKAIDKTLLQKTGTTNDIVATVKYLIEGTDYMTGSIVNVDGGRSIY